MTATVENAETTGAATGRVARVIGPVVDVEFPPDSIPDIHNALHVDRTLDGEVMFTERVERAAPAAT